MKLKKQLLSTVLALSLLFTLVMPVQATEADIVILYTNDVHTYIDNAVGEGNENELTYSKVAALKDSLNNSILVDAGDHIQGTAFGSMDNGKTIIKLMNAAGYDVATLGNHEFDYNMAGCLNAIAAADFPYISSNFYHEKDGITGNTVLNSYQIIEKAGKKIAFVGITTPESFTKTTPAYFQDENGNYIYGIAGGNDGSALYDAVQKGINDAQAAGADYIIALGHLGIDPSSSPWTSKEVIANTSGLDAFIDGHSHSVVPMETVSDETGESVILTQTGQYLDAIGMLTIKADGTISSTLLSCDDLVSITADAEIKALEDNWMEEINIKLGKVIGYADITFDNYDANGNRLVRKQNTNSGSFAADALYYLFDEMDMDVDVAIMNGGGIRNKAITGELSYLTCKAIHTFGNVACLQTVTGQQILDALEWGTAAVTADGNGESGGFLHTSGLKYTLDLTIPSTVQKDEKNIWIGGPTGEYRVRDVQVLNNETNVYEPLDLTAKYNLAGYNYTLRDLGDGFAMFDGAINVLDYVAEDYMVLANYIESFPVNNVTGLHTIDAASGYADINGDGRITIIYSAETGTTAETNVPIVNTESASYIVVSGDSLWKIAQKYYGKGSDWTRIYDANKQVIANPNILYRNQTLAIPK